MHAECFKFMYHVQAKQKHASCETVKSTRDKIKKS